MSDDNQVIFLVIIYNSIIITAIVLITVLGALFTGTMWGLISFLLLFLVGTFSKK